MLCYNRCDIVTSAKTKNVVPYKKVMCGRKTFRSGARHVRTVTVLKYVVVMTDRFH